MASRYNFSITRINKITGQPETFQVIEANSFDEARKEVERGAYDQELAEKKYFDEHPESAFSYRLSLGRSEQAIQPAPFPSGTATVTPVGSTKTAVDPATTTGGNGQTTASTIPAKEHSTTILQSSPAGKEDIPSGNRAH